MSQRRLSLAAAEALARDAFIRANTAPDTAACVARALIAAEADGQPAHGLVRVPTYAAQAKAGKVDGHARPTAELTRPGSLLVDAHFGFAYPALDLAIERLPLMARSNGIAIAAVTRSHHCGAAGLVVEALAREGLVSMLFANTPAAIAPWGGRRGLFGTNPLAFACPRPHAAPIVIDMALSKIARGKVVAAKKKGERIPEGWALDAEGRPTTDPDAALAGTMVPLGDAKGTALALMVELLAAGLPKATYAADATSFLDAKGGPPATGQTVIAIDPTAFGGPAVIDHFEVLARQIEDEPGARLPGSRRLQLRDKAALDGIVIDEALAREIEAI
jgi:(2R)-3-sulfolactate dehydrogenase (NADP+)